MDTYHKARPEVLRRETQAVRTAFEPGAAGLIWWHFSDEPAVREVLRSHPETPVILPTPLVLRTSCRSLAPGV